MFILSVSRRKNHNEPNYMSYRIKIEIRIDKSTFYATNLEDDTIYELTVRCQTLITFLVYFLN